MALSPMMQQYVLLKEQHADCLLFFRLGDFYEMFFEDAITAARELEITLTARDCGLSEKAPMCGVPYHAVESYVSRLVERGFKVAICEQLSDPAQSKGLVERDVVRIITAGTLIETGLLQEKENNYILAVCVEDGQAGLCWADISTGEMYMEQLRDGKAALAAAINRIGPTEMLLEQQGAMELVQSTLPCLSTLRPDEDFDKEAATKLLKGHLEGPLKAYGVKGAPLAVRAAGALLRYWAITQKRDVGTIASLAVYAERAHMQLDPSARRNLELTETLRGRSRKGSLLWLLDETATSMGARTLRGWIEQPLYNTALIGERLDAVGELREDPVLLDELRARLKGVYDMERLLVRVGYEAINPRECLSLAQSLQQIPGISALTGHLKAPLLCTLIEQLDPLEDVCALLKGALLDEPAIMLREGGIIRAGYSAELDELHGASSDGRQWLLDLEAREREETGIKNLKIGFTKVFGYFIEVTRSNLAQVPYRYQRKQTVAGGERYITEELKKIEEAILGAQEKAVRLEYRLFAELRGRIGEHTARIRRTAHALKATDALQSLAMVAYRNDYCRPALHDGYELHIEQGRHPVVERLADGPFVPNDALLTQDERLAVITGPNMSGKSTYMRQVALIALMAHIGSFVPATSAKIPLIDAIFTRVGASDDLAAGQSTFMVEMQEMADILKSATKRSLLILDEIGRGTSTFDGLSIAWATVEHVANEKKMGAKTLFATHYHELADLEGVLGGVVNYFVDCREMGEDIVFLRQVKRGGADRSYGVHVAALAGLPASLVGRAKEILAKLEVNDVSRTSISDNILKKVRPKGGQVNLHEFPAIELAQRIAALDVNCMTPKDALDQLFLLREEAKKV